MTRPKIRTLLIEDSGLMRIVIADLLRRDENIEVVGTAINGQEGVEKAKTLKPDVVVTDMVMPNYDGLFVVRQLMKTMPLPIILLSALDRADPKIFDALREGAFDFIDKPQEKSVASGYAPLTNMVKEASLTDYLRLQLGATGKNNFVHSFEARLNYDIIAIGASTGGPSAVKLIINNLPDSLTIPVVIGQHMPERFIESFAARLADATKLKISVAKDGQALLANHIYLAPGNANMKIVLSEGTPVAVYSTDSYKEYNNPSIDCLLESVAAVYGSRGIGVILTGMGKDGVAGLRKMKDAGALTISQDELSSVVYGMPKAAFESGAALRQIPLKDISQFIIGAL